VTPPAECLWLAHADLARQHRMGADVLSKNCAAIGANGANEKSTARQAAIRLCGFQFLFLTLSIRSAYHITPALFGPGAWMP
jgi:hypothetical protein